MLSPSIVMTARHLLKTAPRLCIRRAAHAAIEALGDRLLQRVREWLRAEVDLDAGMDALIPEDLHQRRAVRGLLADGLVVQDDAADVLGNARRAEQHLAVRPAVVFRVFDADGIETPLDGAGALVRCEDALAGHDQRASDLGDVCHGVRIAATTYARDVVDDAVLRTSGLTKRFGELTAVDHLDLHVNRGEVVGLLGPNGAGKSTTIGMVLGLVGPTAGSAQVLGHDVATHREKALAGVGAMLEVTSFYPHLSGRDNLVAVALLRGDGALARVDPVLTRIGLAPRADPSSARTRRHAQRLASRPRCSETRPWLSSTSPPTDRPRGPARDPRAHPELAKEGRGVLLASHLLHEVEQVCDASS